MNASPAAPLLTVEIRSQRDVVLARQRAKQIAEAAGFGLLDRTRIGTATSEIARNAVEYAHGGQVRFQLADHPPALTVIVEDRGPGLGHLDEVLAGTYVSPTGMGIGLAGTRRLMDEFHCATGPQGTTIRFAMRVPAAEGDHTAVRRRIEQRLVTGPQPHAEDEINAQNHELMRALDDLKLREQELIRLNRELEATNRGVVALYAELDQRAEQLRQASEIKSRFLSNMTHEFRTPLNSIIALTRMLLDRADGPLEAEQERQVGFIRKGAMGLAEMVDDLLDLAKVESGKVDVTVGRFRLADMFDSLRGTLKPLLAHNHSVALVIEDPVDLPPLHSDEGKLAQVVRNFIANALKFTERGEVRVTARPVADGQVAITVADTGIGISTEDQLLLFTDFSQVKSNVQRRIKGTGLGLSLSKKLAELLGGTVSVTSTIGHGSCFTVQVPIAFREAGTHGDPPPLPDIPAVAPRCEVLHIEDDEAFRYVLRSALSRRYRYTEAADGETGLHLARHAAPSVIVLDLELPRMDGFAVLAALRAEPATAAIPVIVLSSYAPAIGDPRLAACLAVIDKNATDDPGGAIAQALRGAGIELAS